MAIGRSGEYVKAKDMVRVLRALLTLMSDTRTGWTECGDALLKIIEEIEPVAKRGK